MFSFQGRGKNNQTPKAKTESLRLSHVPFIMLGTRVKAGGVSVIPVTASSAAIVRGEEATHTGCFCMAGWGGRTCAHICERGYRATELC